MSASVQFVKELSDAILPKLPADTYVVYHRDYDVPDVEDARGKIEFEEFRRVYPNLHAGMFIVYGLNKIITPSNRTDFVFEFLFTLSADVPKISVDYRPFAGEPWRLWFHYGLCKRGNFGTPYSYSIETEWKHWFYRETRDSRFEPDNLAICLGDAGTYSNLDALLYEAEFEDVDCQEWYEEARAHAFAKYDTPKLLIQNVLKLCNARFKLKYGVDSYLDGKVKLPDLPVYRFVDEECRRRASIYNKIVEIGGRDASLQHG
jgi:hypothetical protein